MSALLISIPLPLSVSRLATEPTIVTSRPSRTQTVPRPKTILQCNLDQGRRSSRAGIWVLIILPAAAVPAVTGGTPDASLSHARAPATFLERGPDDALAVSTRLRG